MLKCRVHRKSDRVGWTQLATKVQTTVKKKQNSIHEDIQNPVTSSNIKDRLLECIKKAKRAITFGYLERAIEWLDKSQWILQTTKIVVSMETPRVHEVDQHLAVNSNSTGDLQLAVDSNSIIDSRRVVNTNSTIDPKPVVDPNFAVDTKHAVDLHSTDGDGPQSTFASNSTIDPQLNVNTNSNIYTQPAVQSNLEVGLQCAVNLNSNDDPRATVAPYPKPAINTNSTIDPQPVADPNIEVDPQYAVDPNFSVHLQIIDPQPTVGPNSTDESQPAVVPNIAGDLKSAVSPNSTVDPQPVFDTDAAIGPIPKAVTDSNSLGGNVVANKEEVEACIKKAVTAFSNKNLQKAEKWLLKSLRMCPTRTAQEMLSKVQKAISESEEAAVPDSNTVDNLEQNDEFRSFQQNECINCNSSEADKCFELAKKALALEDFDKCERLFLKAQRMNRSLAIDTFLKEIQAAKASKFSSDRMYKENPFNNTQVPLPELIEEEAEVYLEIAQNALRQKDVERAEQFLSKSVNCFPTERAKELQKKIDDAKIDKSKCIREANKFFEAAINALVKEDFNKSERLFLKAQRINRSLDIDTFLKKIQLAKAFRISTDEACRENPFNSTQGPPAGFAEEEANVYLEIAENALKGKDLEKAEQFLSKSVKCFPTGRAKEVKRKLDDAKLTKSIFNVRSFCYENSIKHNKADSNVENITYEKYLEDAEGNIKMGYLEAAKRNLLEAKRMCPQYNEKVEQLLAEIQANKTSENGYSKLLKRIKDLKEIPKQDKNFQNRAGPHKNKKEIETDSAINGGAVKQQPQCKPEGNSNKEKSERYLVYADDYIKLGFIEDAERIILEAKHLCPQNNEKVEQLLAEINYDREKSPKNSNNKPLKSKGIPRKEIKKGAAKEKVSSNKKLQEYGSHKNSAKISELLETAMEAFDSGNLMSAKRNLQKAHNLRPNDFIEGLLEHIEEKLKV